MPLAPLRLLKREDRRLRSGHVWVFSNEVDNRLTPLTSFEPGQLVRIEDSGGRPLGTGYVNPAALICARLVSRDSDRVLDESLLVERLRTALALRERLFDAPYYRLAFGDSDFLPGLVVDRFGDTLVVQITTAGMERLKPEIVSALSTVVGPRAVLWRNDSTIRALEGLDSYVTPAFGDVPESIPLIEHGLHFEAPLAGGQKTGWFYDQRLNRVRLASYARGARVLDVFSYLGAFGVRAASAGATSVVCVDSSAKSPEWIRRNAELNGVADKVRVERDDAFEYLRRLRAARERFDIVIIDPPAFIKRKKDLREGTNAYQRLNQMAMQVLAPDGLLVSCSCSYHLTRESLHGILRESAQRAGSALQITEEGYQGPDHPMHPSIPETAYLKTVFARVLARSGSAE